MPRRKAPTNDFFDEDDIEPQEFEVERILDKKFDSFSGEALYLIKWKDYPDTAKWNSWEPLENLGGARIYVAEFEADLERKEATKFAASAKIDCDTAVGSMEVEEVVDPNKRGYERNLKPELIVKSEEREDCMYFEIKWKGSQVTDWVSAAIVQYKDPELIIAYYERLLNTPVHDGIDLKKRSKLYY